VETPLETRHEYTKVIFTIQYIWRSTNSMNLQSMVTKTKPDGLEEEEELKLRRVLLIMLHFNVKHSPVYIGVCIQQPKT
jgi:hypothetical protein